MAGSFGTVRIAVGVGRFGSDVGNGIEGVSNVAMVGSGFAARVCAQAV